MTTEVRIPPSGPFVEVGGAVLPLSSAFWLDSNTTSVARDGSIANPFIGLDEAFAALPVSASEFTLLLVPGSYGDLNLPEGFDKQLAIVGMSGDQGQNTSPIARVGTLTLNDAAGNACVSLSNIYVDTIASPAGPQGGTVGNALTLSQCYVALGCVSRWANLYATGCGFAFTENLQFVAGIFRECSAYARFQLAPAGSGGSLTWDEATERQFGLAGAYLAAGNPVPLKVFGSDAPGLTGFDSVDTEVGPLRVVYWQSLLTADRDLNLAHGTDPATVVVDVYNQDFELDIADDTTSTTLVQIPPGTAARRYTFFAPAGENPFALVGVEALG